LISFDPPITTDSYETIKKVAIEMSELMKINNIKTIRLVSSKFLRCLMTA